MKLIVARATVSLMGDCNTIYRIWLFWIDHLRGGDFYVMLYQQWPRWQDEAVPRVYPFHQPPCESCRLLFPFSHFIYLQYCSLSVFIVGGRRCATFLGLFFEISQTGACISNGGLSAAVTFCERLKTLLFRISYPFPILKWLLNISSVVSRSYSITDFLSQMLFAGALPLEPLSESAVDFIRHDTGRNLM